MEKTIIRHLTHFMIKEVSDLNDTIFRTEKDIVRTQLQLIELYEQFLPIVEKKLNKIVLSESEERSLYHTCQSVFILRQDLLYMGGIKQQQRTEIHDQAINLLSSVERQKESIESPLLFSLLHYIEPYLSPSELEDL